MVASMIRRDWLVIIILLWIAFFVRIHEITTLPPFNDESLHIRRAEVVFSDRDIALTPSKTLVYFWLGLFDVDREGGVWVARVATSLFSLLGLAGVYATARYIFGRFGGFVSLLLAAFSPFLFFFDRIALSDPFAAALVIIFVWLTLRFAQRPQSFTALGLGMMLFLTIYAKILNLPFVALPPIALLIYHAPKPPRYTPHAMWQWGYHNLSPYWRKLGIVYTTFVVCWLPSTLHVIERTLTGQRVMIVNNNLVVGLAEEKTPLETILQNFRTVWNIHWILHSPLLWLTIIIAFVLILWQFPRHGLFLFVSIALAWCMPIILSAELSTRYLLPAVLISFVGVGGLAEILRKTHPKTQWIIWGLISTWLVFYGIPFIRTAWHDPTELSLPTRDQWEYFSNFSSGYALVDAAQDFYQLPISQPSNRVHILGLVGSCHQIRLYLPDAYAEDNGPVWLTCLEFGWQGELLPQVIETIQAHLKTESQVYLLIEPDLPFFEFSALEGYWHWEQIKVYSRPYDGMKVVLYHIQALDESSSNKE